MGFAAMGDAFSLRGDVALQDVNNCVKVVNDILLYDGLCSVAHAFSPTPSLNTLLSSWNYF